MVRRLGVYAPGEDVSEELEVGITTNEHNLGRRKYEYSDHLGNVRVVFYDRKQMSMGTIAAAYEYYPFGMSLQSYGNAYRYGFNGKERDEENASDTYDFGARLYDARLGRWLAIDPLFKKYTGWSPFNYAANNPIVNIDYDGRDIYNSNNVKAKITIKKGVLTIENESEIGADLANLIRETYNHSSYGKEMITAMASPREAFRVTFYQQQGVLITPNEKGEIEGITPSLSDSGPSTTAEGDPIPDMVQINIFNFGAGDIMDKNTPPEQRMYSTDKGVLAFDALDEKTQKAVKEYFQKSAAEQEKQADPIYKESQGEQSQEDKDKTNLITGKKLKNEFLRNVLNVIYEATNVFVQKYDQSGLVPETEAQNVQRKAYDEGEKNGKNEKK